MPEKEIVTLTIDGKTVQVPKGTNLIEAAKVAGIDIPYYCYHPHLSIAGNCRMCQVQVEGQPKLTIGCNTGAANGMVVRTQESSPDVAEAQRATLEFLLINHPLDCTVCDQAGHCKLQDYYYEYNSKASRFIEDKVHKVKAEVLGPDVVYDGERCIVCTRCVRFCDEVSHTSELGVFNRGDRAVIGVDEGRILDNPLSGTVVDLCPVGALTHRRWRFNTRIWYTNEVDSICPGCSTGCNVKVAERDGKVVHVKARLNSEVNKEWLCDEGRYGFERFQPEERLASPMIQKGDGYESVSWEVAQQALSALGKATEGDTAVFLSPFLTLEELWVSINFSEKVFGIKSSSPQIAMQLRIRELSSVEKVLISPDYAPNAQGGAFLGLGAPGVNFREELSKRYQNLLSQVKQGKVKHVLFVGDFAVSDTDVDEQLKQTVLQCESSTALTPRGFVKNGHNVGTLNSTCRVLLPSRTVNEKNGLMMNEKGRVQRLQGVLTPPFGTFPEWLILKRIADSLKKSILPAEVIDERSLFRYFASQVPQFADVTLRKIGELGLALGQEKKDSQSSGDDVRVGI